MPAVLKRLRGDARGSISVEFAVLLPTLAVLFLAAIEITALSWARSAVSDAAGAAADLTTQFVAVEEDTMAAVMEAAARKVDPEGRPQPDLRLTVTSVLSCACSPGSNDFCFTVLWSHRYENGALKNGHAQGTDLSTVPQALGAPEGGALVLAEAEYDYAPEIGFVVGDARIGLTSSAVFRPRKSREVVHTGGFAVDQANSCG